MSVYPSNPPVSIRRARRPRRPAARAAALAWLFGLGAWGGGAGAAELVTFSYRAEVKALDTALTPQIRVYGSDVASRGGTLDVSEPGLGPFAIPPRQTDLAATVWDYGNSFSAVAETPLHTAAPSGTDIVQTTASVVVAESFVRTSFDDRAGFTYSGALLGLFRDPEFGSGIGSAVVSWNAQVIRHADPAVPVWADGGTAILVAEDRQYRLYTGRVGGFGGHENPVWRWACAACGGPDRSLATAELLAPYRGTIDLSGVPFVAGGVEQDEFTIMLGLTASAFHNGRYAGASAFGQDPLGVSGGLGIEVFGLSETGAPIGLAPIPEPGSATLMLLGVGALLWRRRAAALAAPALLLALSTQAATLQNRTTSLLGSFVVGYATVGDNGSSTQRLTDLAPSWEGMAEDAGAVDEVYRGLPVVGSASFLLGQAYDIGARAVHGEGSSLTTLVRGAPYVSATSNGSSTLRLVVRVPETTEFRFTVQLDGAGAPLDSGMPSWGSSARLGSLAFNTPGLHTHTGTLFAGDYELAGDAWTRGNAQADWTFDLLIGPVPEPATWATLALGLGLLAWRRRASVSG
jgi:hypothetical protein